MRSLQNKFSSSAAEFIEDSLLWTLLNGPACPAAIGLLLKSFLETTAGRISLLAIGLSSVVEVEELEDAVSIKLTQ